MESMWIQPHSTRPTPGRALLHADITHALWVPMLRGAIFEDCSDLESNILICIFLCDTMCVYIYIPASSWCSKFWLFPEKQKKWLFQITTAVVLEKLCFHLNGGHASISMIVHDCGMFGELKNMLLHRYSQISAVFSNTQLDHLLQKRV